MATGNYGTVRPADVTVDDVEILFSYTQTRESLGTLKLEEITNVGEVLVPATNPNNATEILGGLYTLKLPTSKFGSKGYYSIIIRPKQIRTIIQDCGSLIDTPNVKGLVFDITQISADMKNRFENNQLGGYRVEYLDDNDNKIPNFYRIITSNNRAIPVTPTNGSSDGWSFNDNASTTFCTLTPSSAPSIRPNAIPDIGKKDQKVIITNTFFDPVMLEVEMVEFDDETLAYGLFSNQTKSLEDGVYTIYNFGNEIYRQYNLYEVKDQFTGKPLYEVREQKQSIDPTKDFDDITNF
tara:strand:- start:5124 stop:6008 length:885 start_codon:yes stop_codon:yes gene_type:complete